MTLTKVVTIKTPFGGIGIATPVETPAVSPYAAENYWVRVMHQSHFVDIWYEHKVTGVRTREIVYDPYP